LLNCINLALAGVTRRVWSRVSGRRPAGVSLAPSNAARRPVVPACLLAAVLIPALGHAQAVPDAGTLLQQIERQQHTELPPKSEPQFLPPPVLQSTGDQTVVVSEFRFAGNTLLTAKQLATTVAGFIGRPLSFADRKTWRGSSVVR